MRSGNKLSETKDRLSYYRTVYLSSQKACYYRTPIIKVIFVLLACLFSKKKSRYCCSPVGGGIVIGMQNLWHFLISLSLLKIYT